MPDRPLLLFPTPETADRTRQRPQFRRIHKPDLARQGLRLSPMFHQLQATFNARRVEIQQTTAGIDPEQVLVIETVGGVDKFANAVRRIDGLEWMGELESDEIAPDQDFYDEVNPEKELSGRLYLVMTNQRALNEILSLWRHYQEDPEMGFGHGLTRFRDVFLHLKSVHRWGVQDRLFETRLIEVWREKLKYEREKAIPFEAELWFRRIPESRQSSELQVSSLVQELGGRVLSQSVIEGIAYHGLLAELPPNAIRAIVDDPNTKLVQCDNVMFLRPVGQMVVGDHPVEGEVVVGACQDMPLPAGEPVIALLDGLPLANHRLLDGRLIIDDPDNWEADYAASERVHGTSMASLIVHGDINEMTTPLSRPLYVRPIMRPAPWPDPLRPERVPENCLAVELIHRAVRRIFEGDAAEGPIAPQVRVVNLSIGDASRQFTQSMSPMARLLDWLSVRYRALFVVSAGNHSTSIPLGVSTNQFKALPPGELEAATIKALYQDARQRKLLAPAESINGLTVGAVHYDASQGAHRGARFDPFEKALPSPVSAFGSGYRRAVKPDIVFNGGRQWYWLPLQPAVSIAIEPAIFRTAPGNKAASPGSVAGELTATSYSCGTSNATALISRAAGICYESLQQILDDRASEMDPRTFEAPLLKAMLVHGCSWGDIGDRISEVLRTPQNAYQLSGLVSRWMGYGKPRVDRVLDCTEQRATLLGYGQLSDGEAHVFRLPLPPSLASRPEWRRLTVTLAWLSPISASTQRYRTASLWFQTNDNGLVPTRRDADWRAVRRGTVQHEVFEGQRAEPFIDGDVIEIKVNCREDAGKIQNPVPYGIAVSLEVSEGVDIAVYDEIRTRIAPAIEIRSREATH